eukprot:1513989-Amphidinium_carterae.2
MCFDTCQDSKDGDIFRQGQVTFLTTIDKHVPIINRAPTLPLEPLLSSGGKAVRTQGRMMSRSANLAFHVAQCRDTADAEAACSAS